MGKKRGNAEGSVYKRRDNRWAATIHLGYENGKRKRRTFYSNTRQGAVKKLAAAQRAVDGGLPLPSDTATVSTFLRHWLNESARPSVRPRTFQSYQMIVELHLVPALGRARLTRLAPDALETYMNGKLEDGLKPLTIRNHLAVLRRALNQALRWGLVQRNVASLVTPPRDRKQEVQPLSPDEARALLDAVKGDRLEALFGVALGLGLRQGEVLALAWDDVDLEDGTLSVRHTLQRYDGAYHLDEPKTSRSRRTIALPRPLIEALRAHKTQQVEERLRAGQAWDGNQWHLIFTTMVGKPLSGAVVTHRFQEILAAAGLPRQKFHDLRHAAASFMLVQGVAMRVVMEVLGHSSIAVTANTYSHVMPALQRDATDSVGKLLWATS
ncbi:MAG: site-specific integrase [Chloroflexi bacterium]|nr:site-specific integrase [Chloroflexota bacterium]